MTVLRHVGLMAARDLRALWRQPWYIAVTLVQPVIWLLLFGELFKGVADLPGFSGSYIAYLAPGIVVMSALFSSGWSGMGTIEDIDRGVTDRLLVSPVRRSALIAGRVAQGAVVIVIQSVIMVGLALAVGASFPGGVLGVAVLILVAALLGAAFGALLNSLALVTRQEESLIGAVTFLGLPLTFLSTALMSNDLLPGWMRTVAEFNPVDWAIEAGRSAVAADPDWEPDRRQRGAADGVAAGLRGAGDTRVPQRSGERVDAHGFAHALCRHRRRWRWTMVISTRRLRARPAAVRLAAIGLASPWPKTLRATWPRWRASTAQVRAARRRLSVSPPRPPAWSLAV